MFDVGVIANEVVAGGVLIGVGWILKNQISLGKYLRNMSRDYSREFEALHDVAQRLNTRVSVVEESNREYIAMVSSAREQFDQEHERDHRWKTRVSSTLKNMSQIWNNKNPDDKIVINGELDKF